MLSPPLSSWLSPQLRGNGMVDCREEMRERVKR